MIITVTRLDQPYHSGDWHDKPLAWAVDGPGLEVQHFSTRKNAELYARCRRKASGMNEASNLYCREYLK